MVPYGGPVTRGLQLRLTVGAPGHGSATPHAMELTLQNVSDSPLTLVGDPVPADVAVLAYADAMPHYVWFSVYPEVEYRAGGMGLPELATVQALTLQPGDEVRTAWESPNDLISCNAQSMRPNSRFWFPSDGLYFVRAGVDVRLIEGGGVRLWSNEVPYVVGTAPSCPKPPIARILEFDADGAVLNVGRNDGTDVGDVYEIPSCKGHGWRFTVVKVDSARAWTRADWFGSAAPRLNQELPRSQDKVFLQRRTS